MAVHALVPGWETVTAVVAQGGTHVRACRAVNVSERVNAGYDVATIFAMISTTPSKLRAPRSHDHLAIHSSRNVSRVPFAQKSTGKLYLCTF